MRTALSRVVWVLVSLSLAAPLLAQTDYNGIWSGTFTLSQTCEPGTITSSGPATAYFNQTGSQVTGAIGLSTVSIPNEDCKAAGTYLLVIPISGNVSGSALLTRFGGSEIHTSDITFESFQVRISVSLNTMTLSFTDDTGASIGGGTLQRTSNTPQPASIGASTGGYSATDKWELCSNAISYSGSFSGTAVRAGALVEATGSVTGSKFPNPNQDGTCSAVDGVFTALTLNGQINGSSVTGSVFFVGIYNFQGTISGNSISGTATGVDVFGINSTLQLNLSVLPTTGGGGAAKVVVSQLPAGMIQPAGQTGATDKFSITNNGDAATQITLAPSASFYTLSETSFSLAAGQTKVVTIAAKAQPAGTYTDSLAVSGSGVSSGTAIKVQLLSANPPAGNVSASTTVARLETVSTGTSATGSIEFTNTGNDTLQGLVTADVPWLTPTNPIITIPAGGKGTINFTIDRSKRPDADSLLGSVSCNLFLTFLSGGTGAKPVTLANGSSRTVSVPVQDTVKPAVTNGSPSALAAGELALFAVGMRSNDRLVSDLVLVNARSASVPDVKLFAATSASAFSKVLNVPTLSGDSPAAFAAIAKNAFDINGPSASVQLRSAQAASVGINPMQVSTPAGRASYATALPTLRSDSGASASQKLFLPGVEKSSSLSTTLDLQEMTGAAASILTEFLKADGSVLSSRTDSLAAFGFLEVSDAVPSGATAVRLTNTTAGRLGAYARVNDASTGDSFTVIDPKAAFPAASGDLIVPILPGSTPSFTRFVDVMNASSSSASIRVTTVGGSERRRAVRSHGSAGGSVFTPQTEADKTITLGAQQTSRVTIDAVGSGFVRLNSTSPVVASGRFVATSNGASFGSALPAIPVSASLSVNQSRRFTGVSDASTPTIAAATPGTYRPTLLLIETAGQNAKVRVTLNYTLPGGSRANASAIAQKEFTVNASQSLVVPDLAGSVIGASRGNIGDLRNMQVDIDVIDGAGRVIPVLGLVDNSTGDLMVRSQ